ncbi:MAG: 3-phosphoshikimate 1-carboxyvinyltransferase [Bacillota bacterium]
MAPLDYRIEPGGQLQGRLRVPGDKSISHRALLLGAIAEGETRIEGFLPGADCLATLAALRALGVEAATPAPDRVVVRGRGREGLRAPKSPLDLGNSGTAMRLLAGLLAGQDFTSTLTGDDSLSRRPMRRVIEPLAEMGVRIESRDGKAPLTIHGTRPLKPLRYAMPVASAQVKSALLIAGLYAGGYTWIREPGPSRDHTERMLEAFGHECLWEDAWVGIHGGGSLHGTQIDVPGDLSSAAFFLVGAAMCPGSRLVLENVGVNPTRDGVIRILRAMGADIRIVNPRDRGAEPVADIEVQGARLKAVEIDPELVALAIDDIPAVLIAAATAEGVTRVHGAAELRVKESDRLEAMHAGLSALGITTTLSEDGISVMGVERFRGGVIQSHGDHRIAMAFAMAALKAASPLTILDCANVDTSFPGFVAAAEQLGLPIHSGGRRAA